MNYYKQGDAAKADKIKAAFEKLGYEKVNVLHIGDYANERLFFFTVNGKVKSTLKDCGIVHIIKTHPDYKELELPVEPKFKVGDWVVKKDGKTFYGGNYAVQITSIEVDEGSRHIWLSSTTWVRDNDIRLWSIADAKDGDVLATDNGWTCIFKAFDGYGFSSYCFIDSQKWFCEVGAEGHTLDSRINGNIHPATKEQHELLFKKMKEAGYQWNEEKKELRKIQPHYDIANFHAGMSVLVRPDNDCCWDYSVFSRNTGNEYWHFAVCNGVSFTQCIPFEGNEHLLGTTDMPSEEYINW